MQTIVIEYREKYIGRQQQYETKRKKMKHSQVQMCREGERVRGRQQAIHINQIICFIEILFIQLIPSI